MITNSGGEQSDPKLIETVAKIKNLLDKEEEQLAIDMVIGLNDPKLYAELLRDCSIDVVGNLSLSHFFNDPYYSERENDDRPFFLSLIKHCPEEATIDNSLRRENLTSLVLPNCKSLEDLDALSDLTELTYLHLFHCYSLSNLDGLSGLKET